MADDRLFHKRLGHSRKVNLLTVEEEIVWRTYVQEADDFGVMPFSAVKILHGHARFEKRPLRVLQAMLDRVHDVGLVWLFEHQGQVFCYQHDWQDYQKLRYAVATTYPRLPGELLAACTPATQWLHTVWPGGHGRTSKLASPFPPKDWTPPTWALIPEQSRNVPGIIPERSVPRARGRTRGRVLTGTGEGDIEILGGAGGNGSAGPHDPQPSDDAGLSDRAGRFIERYRELYPKFRHGAYYVSRPTLDFQESLLLVRTWDDARLEQLVEAFLTTDEPFCRNGSGTIAQFRSRASWCDARLRERGL